MQLDAGPAPRGKNQSSRLPLFRVKKCWLPTSPKELLKRQNKPLVRGVCILGRTYTVDGKALLMDPESATSTIEFLPVAPSDSIRSARPLPHPTLIQLWALPLRL